jgi:hypothetical protein
LYYIIGNSFLRIITARLDDPDSFPRLKKMRPRPSNFIAWGSTLVLSRAYQRAQSLEMVKRDSKWTLVFEDFQSTKFEVANLTESSNLLAMNERSCCNLKNIFNGWLNDFIRVLFS